MQERSQFSLLLELHELQTNNDNLDRSDARRRIEENLEPSLLSRYRNLKKRKGTAVAILKNCTCSECMIIYPKTHEILRTKDFVHSCEFCGRLLLVTTSSA